MKTQKIKIMKITKKEISSLTRVSSDAFGKNFEIETPELIATRESLGTEIKINLNGVKTTAYMNGASQKEFINAVYDAIKRISN